MTGGPLISFVVLAYNQEKYIRDAVRSALAQIYEPLEILLNDDCSTDRTFELMREELDAYSGPHKVLLNRSPSNVGLASSINRAWDLTTGEFLVAQAGDDVSLPERAAELVRKWLETDRRADLVCSNITVINADGKVLEENKRLPWDTCLNDMVRTGIASVSGCSCAYSRRLQTSFGPLDDYVLQEDSVYPFRALLGGGIRSVDRPLVKYRLHENNLSQPGSGSDSGRAAIRARYHRWIQNRMAIAKEWLRAWDASGRVDPELRKKLVQLARLRYIEHGMDGCSRLETLPLGIKALLWRLPPRYLASMLGRNWFGSRV